MKKAKSDEADELRSEYDLRQLLKAPCAAKYSKSYRAGTNLVHVDLP